MVGKYFVKEPVENLVVLVDSNALVHRGFHALPQTMRTREGEIINAVYGFSMVLLNVLNTVRPKYVVCAFDLPGKTFRHEQFKEYKAQRERAPEELSAQFPRVQDVVRALNIPIMTKKSYEADDIIGTLAKKICASGDFKVLVVTGDMDILQLVNDCVHVLTIRKGVKDIVEFDVAAVEEKYGLGPEQLVDYKGLRGDPSDNIPGVKGIGDKTAVKLLQEFQTLEKVYDASDEELRDVISAAALTRLREQRDMAFQSRDLATIVLDVDIPFTIDDALVSDYKHEDAVKLFRELEFRTLLEKLPYTMNGTSLSEKKKEQKDLFALTEKQKTLSAARQQKIDSGDYVLVQTTKDLKTLVKKLSSVTGFVFDTETTSLDVLEAKLLGISVAFEEGKAWYVDVVGIPDAVNILKPLFENSQVEKWGHHLKYDYHILRNVGIDVQNMTFDTMIASYILDSSRRNHGLDQLAFVEFGYEMQSIEELIGPKWKNQKNMKDISVDDVVFYACEDSDYTLRLKNLYEKQLKKEKLRTLFDEYEMPLVPILAAMERVGVKLDVAFLKKMNTSVSRRLTTLEKKIWEHAGLEFNIKSTVQLRDVLFDKLKIDTYGIKKGKTGYSTAVSELEKLRGRHPIIELLFEYRELEKLRNTYIVPLPELVDKDDRVHTTFNQTITATGRLSSDSPNLQNIPIRTELGREIRKSFVAAHGYQLLSLDYSQIELRIVAALSGDKTMIEVFQKGGDIHKETAARVHSISLEEVTKEQRYAAKSLNFGVLYGMGPYGFARDAGVSVEEAREFIDVYMSQFPKLAEWIAQQKEQAKKTEYATTDAGRRRFLPDIKSSNFQVRAQAERMAVNMPAQGLAADILKKAMIQIFPVMRKKYPKVHMVLQVHDELVFEVPTGDVERFAKLAANIMENAYSLNVPLKAEAQYGKHWGESKEISI